MMIVKMIDSSPSFAANQLRLPTQLRRWLPSYIACVVLILFTLNLNLFRSSQQHEHDAVMMLPPVPAAKELSPLPPSSSSPLQQSPKARTEFPKKIWQTWKVHPLAFDVREIEVGRTWLGKNPHFRYEVLTDWNDLVYVEYHFGPEGFNRPDIVEFYKNVSAAIVKADLLRYMIMYAEGGVYTDIDVEALKPVSKFIPERFDAKDLDMVVGVEIDEPDWKDHPILGPKSRSFCQWTFMSKPQVPVMLKLVEQIMAWLTGVAKKQGVPISKVELDFDEIISGTGPSAFTNAIMDEMNRQNHGGPPITWDLFHDMSESRVVGRVLVLTVEAFAAGQGHSNSGNHEARAALVKHNYHASNWPSRHHRYSHPLYGEVEICNWEDECVKRWDQNVAAFNKLSPGEQQKLIEKKEKEEEAERQREEEEERKRREEEEAQRKKEEEEREKEEAKQREEEAREKEKEKSKEADASKEADKPKETEPPKEADKPTETDKPKEPDLPS